MPFFVSALRGGNDARALFIFTVAALSDGLDGLAARALNQRTRLGAILDPIADKLLTVAAVASLALDHRLPLWLLAIVGARDLAMALALGVLRLAKRDFAPAPTRLGKYATFLLAVTMVLAIARGRPAEGPLEPWVTTTSLLAAECVLASLVQYFLRWKRWMRAPR